VVKITETVVSSYCDFCAIPKIDLKKNANLANREAHKAFLKCTLCDRDLCRKHCTLVTIPRDYTAKDIDEAAFWRAQCTPRHDQGDGRICPECSNQTLSKIGLLILRSLRRKYEEEEKYDL
jgi:hypothetical protein